MSDHPALIWRILKCLNQGVARAYQKGFGARKLVLLLTTIGRKSGVPRVTPLQYEEQDGLIYIASTRGAQADWYRNIMANPKVRLQLQDDLVDGIAEPVTDPEQVADFLELRLQRHPIMIRLIMRT